MALYIWRVSQNWKCQFLRGNTLDNISSNEPFYYTHFNMKQATYCVGYLAND